MKKKSQVFWLVALRVVIGWHFLYEGMVKLVNPNWSSVGYLLDSQGWFKEVFYWMASSPTLLNAIDFMNIWGLIAIGLGLILGLFTPVAIIGGVILLTMYYLSHPPFIELKYGLPMEGSYLLVNKTFIELIALVVLYFFPTGKWIGIDRFILRIKKVKNGREE